MRVEAIPYAGGEVLVSDTGKVFRRKDGEYREIEPTITNGYYSIKIGGERYYIHKLVAELFVNGETEERCRVGHRNGDVLDNRAYNLVWLTPSEVQKFNQKLPEYRPLS